MAHIQVELFALFGNLFEEKVGGKTSADDSSHVVKGAQERDILCGNKVERVEHVTHNCCEGEGVGDLEAR